MSSLSNLLLSFFSGFSFFLRFYFHFVLSLIASFIIISFIGHPFHYSFVLDYLFHHLLSLIAPFPFSSSFCFSSLPSSSFIISFIILSSLITHFIFFHSLSFLSLSFHPLPHLSSSFSLSDSLLFYFILF
jgi:hypothetical protein